MKDPNVGAVQTQYDRTKKRDGLVEDGYWPFAEVGSAESRLLFDWGMPKRTGPDPDVAGPKLLWWIPAWAYLLLDQAWAQGKLDEAKVEYLACMGDPNKKRVLLTEEKMRLQGKENDSPYIRALESALEKVDRECQT